MRGGRATKRVTSIVIEDHTAEQRIGADTAVRRQDRGDFESWFRLDRFANLLVRRDSMLTVGLAANQLTPA